MIGCSLWPYWNFDLFALFYYWIYRHTLPFTRIRIIFVRFTFTFVRNNITILLLPVLREINNIWIIYNILLIPILLKKYNQNHYLHTMYSITLWFIPVKSHTHPRLYVQIIEHILFSKFHRGMLLLIGIAPALFTLFILIDIIYYYYKTANL